MKFFLGFLGDRVEKLKKEGQENEVWVEFLEEAINDLIKINVENFIKPIESTNSFYEKIMKSEISNEVEVRSFLLLLINYYWQYQNVLHMCLDLKFFEKCKKCKCMKRKFDFLENLLYEYVSKSTSNFVNEIDFKKDWKSFVREIQNRCEKKYK